MPKRNFFPVFFLLIFLSILLFLLGKTGVFNAPSSIILKAISPFGRLVSGSSTDTKTLVENKILVSKLAQMQKLAAENQALRDQFETSYPKSQNLLPATVLSSPSLFPAVAYPQYLIIDKGKSDGVKIGSAVVVKDNLVGKVVGISQTLSKVMFVSDPQSNFSARTISIKEATGSGALGVIRGLGGADLVLDNVLLSESISVGDYVATKGDFQIDNTGYPPSLVVGKIASVEKKPSDLFQKAQVKSLLNFSKLETVFVVLGNQ